MRKIAILIFSITIVCVFVFQRYLIKHKKEIEINTKSIPPTQLKTIENHSINLKNENGKYHFLFFFNTECEHCQAEAVLLQKHLLEFQKAEITFISIEPLQNIKAFANKYQLINQPSITFCHIEPDVLGKQFGSIGFPTIFIYNPQNELVKKYVGETKIEALTK